MRMNLVLFGADLLKIQRYKNGSKKKLQMVQDAAMKLLVFVWMDAAR